METGSSLGCSSRKNPSDPTLIPIGAAPADDCNTGGVVTAFGGDVDADCLSPRGVAKNVITVGSVDGLGALGDFTGFGPTDDGRIKPDLMTHGVDIRSTEAANDVDATPALDPRSGTSYSSPAGAGIAALMVEQADRLGETLSPAGMKALLIETAIDFTADPFPRDLAAGEVIQNFEGPDFASGWGIIDAQAAADLLRLPGGPGLVDGACLEE